MGSYPGYYNDLHLQEYKKGARCNPFLVMHLLLVVLNSLYPLKNNMYFWMIAFFTPL
jgi:hypothetical protein